MIWGEGPRDLAMQLVRAVGQEKLFAASQDRVQTNETSGNDGVADAGLVGFWRCIRRHMGRRLDLVAPDVHGRSENGVAGQQLHIGRGVWGGHARAPGNALKMFFIFNRDSRRCESRFFRRMIAAFFVQVLFWFFLSASFWVAVPPRMNASPARVEGRMASPTKKWMMRRDRKGAR